MTRRPIAAARALLRRVLGVGSARALLRRVLGVGSARALLRRVLGVGLAGAGLAGLGLAVGCAAPASGPDRSGNPLAVLTLYVEPDSPPLVQADRLAADGREADAAQLRKIGRRPIAHWLLTGDPVEVRAEVADVVGRAVRGGETPVLVPYYIPHRDCGSYAAGGAQDPAEYRRWIREVAAGIAGRSAIVVLEPDAVPDALDGCGVDRAERLGLLRDAVTVLTASDATRVYLDAGNPSWIDDVDELAGALREAGIDSADGFALNVANFVTTEENVRYGRRLSEALDGAHFVIDTSRNGQGAPSGETVNGAPSWCNPPGRALGPAPTVRTGMDRVDALLWVKRPGDSDGACRPGEPAAGQWWTGYALDLARRSGG